MLRTTRCVVGWQMALCATRAPCEWAITEIGKSGAWDFNDWRKMMSPFQNGGILGVPRAVPTLVP
jgi:hypothetical protein